MAGLGWVSASMCITCARANPRLSEKTLEEARHARKRKFVAVSRPIMQVGNYQGALFNYNQVPHNWGPA